MLPRELRVNSRSDFTTVTRRGQKASCGSVVVYRHVQLAAVPSRAGLVVGRSVGNAVTRHLVSRRLRAILAELLPDQTGELIVVRALPTAAGQAFPALRSQVNQALADCASRTVARGRRENHVGQEPGTVALGSL